MSFSLIKLLIIYVPSLPSLRLNFYLFHAQLWVFGFIVLYFNIITLTFSISLLKNVKGTCVRQMKTEFLLKLLVHN